MRCFSSEVLSRRLFIRRFNRFGFPVARTISSSAASLLRRADLGTMALRYPELRQPAPQVHLRCPAIARFVVGIRDASDPRFFRRLHRDQMVVVEQVVSLEIGHPSDLRLAALIQRLDMFENEDPEAALMLLGPI